MKTDKKSMTFSRIHKEILTLVYWKRQFNFITTKNNFGRFFKFPNNYDCFLPYHTNYDRNKIINKILCQKTFVHFFRYRSNRSK